MKIENSLVKLGILVFLLTVPVACNRFGSLSSQSKGNEGDVGSKAAASPFERPLQLTEPRTLKYASLQFTVIKAVISNRVPNDQPADSAKPATAAITFSVVNTLKDGVTVNSALWHLKLGDGTSYQQPYSDNMAPRDTKERTISFPVPMTAQWKGAQISLDELDKEPVTLALDGIAQQPQYPTKLTSGGETTTKGPAMTYTILGATLDVDAAGQRVGLGKRYLNLSVRVANKEEAGAAGEFLPEFFRLMINGVASAPENMSDNAIVNGASSQEITMSFVVPAGTTSVDLEVGRPAVQQTARIPITLGAVQAKGD